MSLWDLKHINGQMQVKPTIIWTLSLWDLKLEENGKRYMDSLFELCPYGIWNYSSRFLGSPFLLHLNFVPMGFETFYQLSDGRANFIWTLSLWDLKQTVVSLNDLFCLYLNFVPMGFETPPLFFWKPHHCLFELCPYGIWNNWLIKFWTLPLKHLNFVPMGFETLLPLL